MDRQADKKAFRKLLGMECGRICIPPYQRRSSWAFERATAEPAGLSGGPSLPSTASSNLPGARSRERQG